MVVRVIAPQTKQVPEVVAALDASGYEWEAVDVSATDHSYFDLISDLWEQGQTFVTVEHDIVIGPDTLHSFDECLYDWCVAPYPYAVTGYYAGLGCCKITAAMIARNSDVMESVGKMGDEGHPPRHWCRVDGWLRWVLEQRGETFHMHEPPVAHLGDNWPSHGCAKPPQAKTAADLKRERRMARNLGRVK